MEKQSLYSGKVWKNNYQRIKGDPYLFTNYFLPGTVSMHGTNYKNLLLRYDICSDEIMIPVNNQDIVLLNKEMVDSFSITFNNKKYLFSKINFDLPENNDYGDGYFNVLYKNSSILYVRYEKYISPGVTDISDGEFMQTRKIYLYNNGVVYPVKTKNDLYRVLSADKSQVRDYLKNNKLKVTKADPESFIKVVSYCEGKSR